MATIDLGGGTSTPATSVKPVITNQYGKINTSFSGADAVATITPLGGKPRVFGEIQTLSYSIYRPTTPVYTLGRINPKGVVRGQRTIAGSLIFTVFDRHVLKSVMDSYNLGLTAENKSTLFNTPELIESNKNYYKFVDTELDEMKLNMKTDEMPPFDINITFMNEYGNSATLNIYGVHILTEGQTMSIEDMITENTMQYIAMDIDLMDSNGLDRDGR
jgi:hypothetical protein